MVSFPNPRSGSLPARVGHLVSSIVLGAAGCASPLEVEVQLVDPCDRPVVPAVDFIRVELRGSGLDEETLGTVEPIDSFGTAPIELPLVEDFRLLASGFRGGFDGAPAAFGISAAVDLTRAESPVQLRVPLARLGAFHRATRLDRPPEDPGRCAELGQARFGASATVLPGGRVLVVGGARYTEEGFLVFPRRVEVYDPAVGAFLSGPPGGEGTWELGIGQPRRHHTATLLPDGRVLVAGGQAPRPDEPGTEGALASAFLIDPRDLGDLRIPEGGIQMREARTEHRAVVLSDGRVAFIGGRRLNPLDPTIEGQRYSTSVEVYDPSSGAFRLATSPEGAPVGLAEPRSRHVAAAIPGTSAVLVAGGLNASGPVRGVEVLRWDPGGVTRADAGEELASGPIGLAAAVTASGEVVLSGGYATLEDVRGWPPVGAGDAVEVWAVDPRTGDPNRVCTGRLGAPRGEHSATALGRRVAFVGGRDETGAPRADAEVGELLPREEARRRGTCFVELPSLGPTGHARAGHAAVLLPTTVEILVLGGVEADPGPVTPGRTSRTAEVYSDLSRPRLLEELLGRSGR